MTSFVVVNNCTDPALTPDLGQQIAIACAIQLNRDVATYWGGSYRVRWAAPSEPPAPGDVIALIVDDLPDAPGAIGYHNWEGVPDIFIARNMCSTLTEGTGSLSQCLSHELCETVGDMACNAWRDDGAGSEFAQELCDAVESGFYTLMANGPGVPVDVSDFVLPAFFNPGDTQGPYSYLKAAPAPFTTAVGGYQIKRTSGAGETQVTGTVRLERRAKKRHWSSRTYRRGVRLAA